MSFLGEIKRRKVFQVAAVYAVVAWLIMQVVDVVSGPLLLPDIFARIVILVLAIGFPITIILTWAFDLTPDGVARDQGTVQSGGRRIEYVLSGLLVVAVGWSVWIYSSSGPGANQADGLPVVILMDTSAPRGVYDPETRAASGTNADDLNDALRDLPVVLHKEAIGSTWDRDDELLEQRPALILIHRSGFFHSMNQEFDFGYRDDPATHNEQSARRLYAVAENKLVAFFGYVGLANPDTSFLVYSRGGTPGWAEERVRYDWIAEIESRFPSLAGRVFAMNVPGGDENATFRDEATVQTVRRNVQSILGLPSGD